MVSVIDCVASMIEGFFVVMWLIISVVCVMGGMSRFEVPVLGFFVVGAGRYN